MTRTYATPKAFKDALEQRLRGTAKASLSRTRQLVVFDRFLARVVALVGDVATLKGGLVLELRLGRARTTRDVDLEMVGSPDELLAKLQAAGQLDLGDFMTFEVIRDDDHPRIQNDGTRYDGCRFRAECRLAGKIYGERFGVDVAFGDPILSEPDVVVANDVLAFAGIAPPKLRIYPVETHIAEKLHAYSMPREQPNSRVKDLPDLALPKSVPSPSDAWRKPYEAMAREDALTCARGCIRWGMATVGVEVAAAITAKSPAKRRSRRRRHR